MRILKRAAFFGALMLQFSGFSAFAQVVPQRPTADSNTFTIPPLGTVLPKFRELPNDPFAKLRRELGELKAFPLRTTHPIMLALNAPKVCAAPLLEAPIPSEDAFNMPQLRPKRDIAPMPEANLPAPACSKDFR